MRSPISGVAGLTIHVPFPLPLPFPFQFPLPFPLPFPTHVGAAHALLGFCLVELAAAVEVGDHSHAVQDKVLNVGDLALQVPAVFAVNAPALALAILVRLVLHAGHTGRVARDGVHRC